jgi:hypothetical protein
MPDVAVQSLGIIFTPFMIRAILNGKKTQTRRLINPQPLRGPGGNHGPTWAQYQPKCDEWEFWGPKDPENGRALLYEHGVHKPRYALGSQPWVKEQFVYRSKHNRYYYKADWTEFEPYAHGGWKSPRAMPKVASRIKLEITDIRAQRVQDTTHEDAVAEGFYRIEQCEKYPNGNAWGRAAFSGEWDIIHKRDGFIWDSNPWVWVYTFKRLEVKSQRVESA